MSQPSNYTLFHGECGQFRPCIHENFEKFEMISTPDGQLNSIAPEMKIRKSSQIFKILMNIGTKLSTLHGTVYSRCQGPQSKCNKFYAI